MYVTDISEIPIIKKNQHDISFVEDDLSCTFEVDECNWFIDRNLNNTYLFEFIRMTPDDIHNGNGPESDHDVNKQGLWINKGLEKAEAADNIVKNDLLNFFLRKYHFFGGEKILKIIDYFILAYFLYADATLGEPKTVTGNRQD